MGAAGIGSIGIRRHLFILILLLAPAAARAAIPSECVALLQADFSMLADAPTQLLQAAPVAAQGAIPEYCRVQGYVRSNVRFELRLPAANWNGKLIMEGCGGFCGSLDYAQRCDERLGRGYACVTTDMGHTSSVFDGKWAFNNREAEIDFG